MNRICTLCHSIFIYIFLSKETKQRENKNCILPCRLSDIQFPNDFFSIFFISKRVEYIFPVHFFYFLSYIRENTASGLRDNFTIQYYHHEINVIKRNILNNKMKQTIKIRGQLRVNENYIINKIYLCLETIHQHDDNRGNYLNYENNNEL